MLPTNTLDRRSLAPLHSNGYSHLGLRQLLARPFESPHGGRLAHRAVKVSSSKPTTLLMVLHMVPNPPSYNRESTRHGTGRVGSQPGRTTARPRGNAAHSDEATWPKTPVLSFESKPHAGHWYISLRLCVGSSREG